MTASTAGVTFKSGFNRRGLGLLSVSAPKNITYWGLLGALGFPEAAALAEYMFATDATTVYVPNGMDVGESAAGCVSVKSLPLP